MKKLFLLLMVICGITLNQASVSAVENYDKDFYLPAIQRKIEINWIKPYDVPNISAIVSFTVNADGSISPISFLRKSENAAFDKSVIDAICKAVPFEYTSTLNKPIALEIFFSPTTMLATNVSDRNTAGKIVNVAYKNDTIDFSDYLNDLETRVNANWAPKAYAKERQNITVIKIDKDGALNNPSVLEPSQDFQFDISTLDAIAKSVPMAPFPSEITAPSTNVQLNFYYKKTKGADGKEIKTQSVSANVLKVEGSDKYADMVQSIFKDNMAGKNTLLERRLIFETQINSLGKLKYVKILKSSSSPMFDRMALEALNSSSFPQFPDTISSDCITLRYELITGITRGIRIFPVIKQ